MADLTFMEAIQKIAEVAAYKSEDDRRDVLAALLRHADDKSDPEPADDDQDQADDKPAAAGQKSNRSGAQRTARK